MDALYRDGEGSKGLTCSAYSYATAVLIGCGIDEFFVDGRISFISLIHAPYHYGA